MLSHQDLLPDHIRLSLSMALKPLQLKIRKTLKTVAHIEKTFGTHYIHLFTDMRQEDVAAANHIFHFSVKLQDILNQSPTLNEYEENLKPLAHFLQPKGHHTVISRDFNTALHSAELSLKRARQAKPDVNTPEKTVDDTDLMIEKRVVHAHPKDIAHKQKMKDKYVDQRLHKNSRFSHSLADPVSAGKKLTAFGTFAARHTANKTFQNDIRLIRKPGR
jgi:hypothetical protein